VSYRYRLNNDKEYRRHNISLAFSYIGNVRVINSNDSFSFEDAIKNKDNFLSYFKI
jgi:hypothetical protein